MIGKIVDYKKDKTNLIFSTCVDEKEVRVGNKKYKVELKTSIIYCPIVKFGDKQYILKWADIINLAKQAGFFNEDQKEEK